LPADEQLGLTVRNQDEAKSPIKKPSNGFRNSIESTKLEPIEEKVDKGGIISNSITIEQNDAKAKDFFLKLNSINISPDHLNMTIGSRKFKNLANS